MSETYEVLAALVKKLNGQGWHTPGCNVHQRWVTPSQFSYHREEPYPVPGGPCDCGADQLVARTNRLLEEIRPGQLDFLRKET